MSNTRTITIELPLTHHIDVPNGHAKTFDTSNWGPEFILDNALHGLKQRRSDKMSVTKDANKLAELDLAIMAGMPLAGVGGGGARQSPEIKGWVAYFALLGHKEDKKPVNGNTVKRAQQTLCRRDLIGKTEPGTPERKDVQNNMQKHLKERFDAWRDWKETNDAVLVECIQTEKDRPAKEASAKAAAAKAAEALKNATF